MSVIFIGGDEPYLVDAKRKAFIGQMQMPELNLLCAEELDKAVVDHLNTYPVIDERRVAVVSLDSLTDADNDSLKECMEDGCGLLLVIFKSYDGRNSFYKDLKKEGLILLCNKQEAAPSLPSFICKRAANMEITFPKDALQEFLQRMNYTENDSINIYTVIGYMESMAALSPVITIDIVRAVVPEYQSEKIFGIVDMILAKDLAGLKIQASLLKKDAIGTLSALLREYRIAYKACYFSLKDIGVTYTRLKGVPKEDLVQGIELISCQIAVIKTGTLPPEMVMTDTFLRLSNNMQTARQGGTRRNAR